VQPRTEGNSALVWVDLDVTESLVKVGSDDDVDGFDGSGEGLIEILLSNLKLKESTINLVDDDDRLDTLTKGLSENGFGLDTDPFDTIDDDKSAISDTKGGGDLGREIDVTGRIDQVDQELVTLNLLWDVFQIFFIRQVCVQGDGGGLDGDASILFILAGVCEPSLASFGSRDDTSALDQRVGECGFSVIDVSNDRHVARGKILEVVKNSALFFLSISNSPNVRWLVHQGTDLVDGKAIEGEKVSIMLNAHSAKLMKLASKVHLLDHFGGGIRSFGLRGGVIAVKVEVAVANSRQMLEATEGSLQ
jgi:hypothetical protein